MTLFFLAARPHCCHHESNGTIGKRMKRPFTHCQRNSQWHSSSNTQDLLLNRSDSQSQSTVYHMVYNKNPPLPPPPLSFSGVGEDPHVVCLFQVYLGARTPNSSINWICNILVGKSVWHVMIQSWPEEPSKSASIAWTAVVNKLRSYTVEKPKRVPCLC